MSILVNPNRTRITTKSLCQCRPLRRIYRCGWRWPVIPLLIVLVYLGSTLLLLSRIDDPETQWVASLSSKKSCYKFGCPTYSIQVNTLDEATKNETAAFGALARRLGRADSVGVATTRQSNERPLNQDRSFIIQPFLTEQTRHVPSFLVAVLDGHGSEGHYVAQYVAQALPKRLAEKLSQRPCCQSDEWVIQQLNDTFVEVDREAPPNALRGGTTASVTLRVGEKLFFANTGDSQTMLVHSTASHDASSLHEIVYQTVPHKPHLPEERTRIESLGGTIHIPPKFPAGSRVVVYSSAAIPPELIGLAMSRSIGDWEWKTVGVIAEPTVHVVTLSRTSSDPSPLQSGSSLFFVMAASDGVWDTRPGQRFAELIGQPLLDLLQQQNRSELSWFLFQLCASVIWKVSPAKDEWYRDDMTIALVPLF